MSIWAFLILQLLIIIGAIVQTTTGSSFVLIVLIGITIFDIVPLEHGVLMIMLLSLVQISVSLRRESVSIQNLKDISYIWVLIPSTAGGVILLYILIQYPLGYQLLYGFLGLASLWVALSFFIQPVQLKSQSPRPILYIFMIIAGIFGGLFSVSGPPLLYILYRQPWSLHKIRQTLYISFAMVILIRGIVVIYQGNFVTYILLWAMLSIPMVAITTWIMKKYLHMVSDITVRNITALFLAISGINILYKSIIMSIEILTVS